MDTDDLSGRHGQTLDLTRLRRPRGKLIGTKVIHPVVVVVHPPIPRTMHLRSFYGGSTIDRKSSEGALQIVPAALGAASMAEVGAAAHLDVEFEEVVGFSVGGFGAKDAFFENDVGVGDAKIV